MQIAALKHGGIGPSGVVLQVNADAIHAGVEHALRGLNRRPCRSLHGQKHVGEGEPRDRRIGLTERIARSAHGFGRRLARQRKKVDDVGAAAEDRGRLALAAVHGLHVRKQQRLGEALPEDRRNVADALIFQERRPELQNGHAGRKRRFRHRQPLRHVGSVERNLEREPLAKQAPDTVRFGKDVVHHGVASLRLAGAPRWSGGQEPGLTFQGNRLLARPDGS